MKEGKKLRKGFLIISIIFFILLNPINANDTDYLLKNMKSNNSILQVSAIDALGHLGNDLAIIPLTKALNDSNSNVRKAAAIALGDIGNANATESLIGGICSISCGYRFKLSQYSKIINSSSI